MDQINFLNKRSEQKYAIAYYRHSAEDKQENSVLIQREHTHEFAKKHGIEIIHEESDEGKTGLLADRPGFNKLFDDWILNEIAPQFEYVLVYDVSRWGRFQDQDEAAYYEFRCKRKGKKVIYVSRGFPDKEQELMSHLQTSIERYMAAEYSRQLSNKVFYGCAEVSKQGYSAGGTACYGMGRLLLDTDKNPIRALKFGEHKQIANERVTFVPLENESTQAVRDIFKMFVDEKRTLEQIASSLNRKGIRSSCGGQWNTSKIVHILTNETYIGNRIYNKTWNRLRQGKRKNPRSDWIVCSRAFQAVVDEKTFKKAQERVKALSVYEKSGTFCSVRKVKSFVQTQVRHLLKESGLNSDIIESFLGQLPMIISVSLREHSEKLLCFVLPNKLRMYDSVLALGISNNDPNNIEFIFKIPCDDFNIGGLILLSPKSKEYRAYLIDNKNIQNCILGLVNDFCAKYDCMDKMNEGV